MDPGRAPGESAGRLRYKIGVLEPVVLHQTRFNTPGLAADGRGVALGKQGAVLLPTFDGLVGWFRVLADEVTLDDLLSSLSILEVRGALQSREMLVLFGAGSSQLMDRAARIARLVGGLCFTGSGKHFVQYRDAAAPLGWDVVTLATEGADDADLVLYAQTFRQAYHRRREIAFADLVFRLSPRPVTVGARRQEAPGGESAAAEAVDALDDGAELLLSVEPGLSQHLLGYLHRSRIEASAAIVERAGGRSAFARGDRAGSGRRLLVRVRGLPRRMRSLFARVPGVDLYVPIDGAEHVVVEAGYRHPLRLESCGSLFDRNRVYLFSGRRDQVEVVGAEPAAPSGSAGPVAAGPPVFTAIERLVRGSFELAGGAAPEPPATAVKPEVLQVRLRVVRTAPGVGAKGHRIAALVIPWDRIERLRRLVFFLPPAVLSSCRAVPLEEGLLVLGAEGLDRLPLGEPHYEVAPGILLPLGFEVVPSIGPEVLASLCGVSSGQVVLLRAAEDRPLRGEGVPEAWFEPLSRRLLARIPVEEIRSGGPLEPPEEAPPAEVVNDPAGAFPLWRYRR